MTSFLGLMLSQRIGIYRNDALSADMHIPVVLGSRIGNGRLSIGTINRRHWLGIYYWLTGIESKPCSPIINSCIYSWHKILYWSRRLLSFPQLRLGSIVFISVCYLLPVHFYKGWESITDPYPIIILAAPKPQGRRPPNKSFPPLNLSSSNKVIGTRYKGSSHIKDRRRQYRTGI